MKKLKWKLHKLLFPKYHLALKEALNLSFRYWSDSPSQEKRGVGEDIYTRISKLISTS